MSERQALVKAMLAEPDDDLPRLVFADWLDEHGESERAAFTRLQVEAARRPEAERGEFSRLAEEILTRHKDDWFGPVTEYCSPAKPAVGGTMCHRGMLRGLLVREDEFVRPEVQRVLAGWGAENGVRLLCLLPHQHEYNPPPQTGGYWEGVRRDASNLWATVRQSVSPNGLAATQRSYSSQVADSPVLGAVAGLLLSGLSTADRHLGTLARSPHLGRLSDLSLQSSLCSDVGLTALAASTGLSNLRAVGLDTVLRPRFTADGVLKLLMSERLPRLTRLRLADTRGSEMILDRVLNHPAAERLTHLNLGGRDAFRLVARSRHLHRLESLHLTWTQVDRDGVADLQANPSLSALKHLWIFCGSPNPWPITADSLASLRERFGSGFEEAG